MKEHKKESKKNKQEAADEKKRADEAEKYKEQSEKAFREIQESHIRLQQAKSVHDILYLQSRKETLKGELHELKFKEEQAKAMIDQNKLGHENILIQQEIENKKAKIKAYNELSQTQNFAKATERHTALVKQQLKNTEKLKMAEDMHKRRMQNIELESKSQAYSEFDYGAHKKEYDEHAKAIVERSVALEAEQRNHDDQIAQFD